MKTLILFGSPSQNGHTMALVSALQEQLTGEVTLVDAYHAQVSPCVDCKRCFRLAGCAIDDDMTAIYGGIEGSDNIVIASPMHFGIVSAPLVKVFSRLQTYWSAQHMRKEQRATGKKGALLITTGTQWPNMRHLLEGVTDLAFSHMRAEWVGSVYAHRTDRVPARENEQCAQKITVLAQILNRGEVL